MIEALRQRLLLIMRIPAFPHVPPGEEDSCAVFRADVAYYRLRLWGWMVRQGFAAFGLVVGVLVIQILLRIPPPAKVAVVAHHTPVLFTLLETLAILGFLIQLPFSYLTLRWDYECRFYVLTERCLRIQEGIWIFREQTFTLANIQNLDVRQGPLQRYFGLSDLVVRTAGGGDEAHEQPGQPPSLHEGRLKGLRDAAGVKAHILSRMKHFRDAGLGDSGDGHAHREAGDSELDLAAREAAIAVRALTVRLAKPQVQSPS